MARLQTLFLALALVVGCGSTPPATDAGSDAALGCPGDSDGDSILDRDEGDDDPDDDGRPASRDDDSDGDGALDALEAGDTDCATPPIDTDLDGTPDLLDRDAAGDFIDDATQHATDADADGVRDAIDLDVDGDSILNRDERGAGPLARDTDGDLLPDVLDLDSDGDDVVDAVEAGDVDPATPPIECEREANGAGEIAPDGAPDAFDLDRDDDGLADGEEVTTSLCDGDSDADGLGDLIEVALERAHCARDGLECGCATDPACQIPPAILAAVLPFGGPPIDRDLEVGVLIRRADVFFAIDTTASMGGTVSNIRATITAPGGIAERVAETIPDPWFGAGQIEDFPFSSYGGGVDRPFALAADMAPGASGGFGALELHGGGDGPEAHVEALYRIVTGEGVTWSWSDRTHAIPEYRADCLDGWGAPCFREGALPVIVLFTDVCAHDAPSGDDATACTPYEDISPAPTPWADMIAALNARDVTFVGVNVADGISCEGSSAPAGLSPCFFLTRVAEETGSRDVGDRPLVFDLPNASEASTFSATVATAIETVVLRVRRDVDAVARNLTTDSGIDARRFVTIGPRCESGATDCWSEPPGTAHDDAVAGYDASSFTGVVPGTRVTFRLRLANDFAREGTTSQVGSLRIELRADRTEVLDSIEILVAVPADDGIER